MMMMMMMMKAVTSRVLFSKQVKQVRVGLISTTATTTMGRILSPTSGSDASVSGGVFSGGITKLGCSSSSTTMTTSTTSTMTTKIPPRAFVVGSDRYYDGSCDDDNLNHYQRIRRRYYSSSTSSSFPRRTLPSLKMDKTTTNDEENNNNKQVVITKWGDSKKYWMSNTEYAGVVVGRDATNDEYVISDGIIGVNGFVPNHYHKWEDQTFHVIEGTLVAQIGGGTDTESVTTTIGPGDTIHCPRNVTHYIKNIGTTEAKVISYIFPGTWAEEFMAETSRQNHEGKQNFNLIEEKFGVVYVPLQQQQDKN